MTALPKLAPLWAELDREIPSPPSIRRAQLLNWIEDDRGQAYVEDAAGHRADLGVVAPAYGPKYLRTHADGQWTNTLLSLPRR